MSESAGPLSPELLAALVDEAGRKSAVLWLTYAGSERARPAWHAWSEGSAYVLGALTAESGEQRLPGLEAAASAQVTCRAKDSRERLVTWRARVERVAPGTPEWSTACGVLRSARLNATDLETICERWAESAFVVRLVPTGEFPERPGAMPSDAGREAPPETPATTAGKLPWVLHRRARRARRLS